MVVLELLQRLQQIHPRAGDHAGRAGIGPLPLGRAQYTFDEGFTGFGTGAGCVPIGSARGLVGYQIIDKQYDIEHTVKRTTIELSDGGRRAANGATVTLGTNIVANSALYQAASSITCGSSGTADEPQS
jgi:hypothetical protein